MCCCVFLAWWLMLQRALETQQDPTDKKHTKVTKDTINHTCTRTPLSQNGRQFWIISEKCFHLCLTCCSNSCLSAVAMDSSATVASRPCAACAQNPQRPRRARACACAHGYDSFGYAHPQGGAWWFRKSNHNSARLLFYLEIFVH